MKEDNLYFIAVLPPPKLRNRIREMKEEFSRLHGASHALKSPAHITLQMPFKRPESAETEMIRQLEAFAARESRFNVMLDGFGAFAPRVIFVRITDPEPLKELHKRLKRMLSEELSFSPAELMKEMQPHITLATRDLTREAFGEAWPEFRDKEFRDEFKTMALTLLKHNGKRWDILRECQFMTG